MEDIKVSMYEIDSYYISITLSLITKIYPDIIRYNKIRYHKRNISSPLHTSTMQSLSFKPFKLALLQTRCTSKKEDNLQYIKEALITASNNGA